MAFLSDTQRQSLQKLSEGPFLNEETPEHPIYRSAVDFSKHMRSTVNKLVKMGHAEIVEQMSDTNFKVRITERGRKYLKKYGKKE